MHEDPVDPSRRHLISGIATAVVATASVPVLAQQNAAGLGPRANPCSPTP
jgi:hypothetical protein